MERICRKYLVALLSVAATLFVGTGQAIAHERDGAIHTRASRIKHVFIIVLENKDYADTFGSSVQDPYLRNTLVPRGALLTQYYGTGHVSLDNYLSLISGQAPTPDTANDCPTYADVEQTGLTPDGQVIAAKGCVYGKHVRTLVDQMEARGLSWRGYMEDMGNDPARETATCAHPQLGTTDPTQAFEAPSAAVPSGDGYATRHNPFMYFHSIIDSPSCHHRVVNLAKLTEDLAHERTTPNFAFITPNLCNDGHDGSGDGRSLCKNGQLGGLASADAFLQTWVPKILASPAFRRDGLLIITFDESTFRIDTSTDPVTGVTTTDIVFPGQACCGQQPGPNLEGIRPGTVALTPTLNFVYGGYGGDRVGALLLSPFIKPGSTSDTAYNHYSLLRSLEDIFGIHEYLGYAANNPRKGYFLDTIGNDRAIFEHDHDPWYEHRHEPWFFPWLRDLPW